MISGFAFARFVLLCNRKRSGQGHVSLVVWSQSFQLSSSLNSCCRGLCLDGPPNFGILAVWSLGKLPATVATSDCGCSFGTGFGRRILIVFCKLGRDRNHAQVKETTILVETKASQGPQRPKGTNQTSN